MSVGEQLINEIERIAAKRERYRSYRKDMSKQFAVGMDISIAVMTAELNEAKAAVLDADPARAIRVLEALRGYNDDE